MFGVFAKRSESNGNAQKMTTLRRSRNLTKSVDQTTQNVLNVLKTSGTFRKSEFGSWTDARRGEDLLESGGPKGGHFKGDI